MDYAAQPRVRSPLICRNFFLFYKLPFRAADKAITSGPDATTNARTASCAITSRFISSTSKTFF